MSVNVWDAPIRQVEGTSKTLGAASAVSYLAIKPGYREAKALCDTAWRMAISPKLLHAIYYTAATTTYTDYVKQVTDGTSAHMPLDGMLTTDYVYLGTTEPVAGFYIDVGTGVNAEAATLDVEYCSTAMAEGATIAFTDVAGDSDGTDSGGATLAQDGKYAFTVPAVKRSRLGTYTAPLFSKCYWTRFKPSATLSATVDIAEIIPITSIADASYGYMAANVEYNIQLDLANVGGLTMYGTENKVVYVTWIK